MLYANLDEVYQDYDTPMKKKKSKKLAKEQKISFNNDQYDMNMPLDTSPYTPIQSNNVKTSPNHVLSDRSPQSCSISAPPYTFPIQPEAMENYKGALDASLNTDPNEIVKSSLKKLRSYNEDDLDQYFDIEYGKPNIMDDDTNDTPITNKMEHKNAIVAKQTQETEQTKPTKPTNTRRKKKEGKNISRKSDNDNDNDNDSDNDKLYELLLFIFIGFIIVALCEMITSLARP